MTSFKLDANDFSQSTCFLCFKQVMVCFECNAFGEAMYTALMDIGVYCIHPMVNLFGAPKTVKAVSHILQTGVDGEGSAVF
ncbi:hypothetical protein BGU85_26935, partial [Clostridioides difficile]